MSDQLKEPGSREPGPRIGVVYNVNNYIDQKRLGYTPPWFGSGYDAGVFLARPGNYKMSMK